MARDTRDKILDAAARLFADSDSSGASLRAIARAAGVNSALIHYHFGSREGLFEAVLLRALGPIQARRRAQIDRLREAPAPPSAEDLARLFVSPLVASPEMSSDGVPSEADRSRDVIGLRLLARAFTDHRPLLQDLSLKHFGPLMYGLGDLLSDALPELPEPIKHRRMRFCVQVALETLSGPEMDAARADGPDAEAALAADLITFLAGGLEAPAKSDQHKSPRTRKST